MKKTWEQPVLEVLAVNNTMGHTNQRESLDKDYEAGTKFWDLTWS